MEAKRRSHIRLLLGLAALDSGRLPLATREVRVKEIKYLGFEVRVHSFILRRDIYGLLWALGRTENLNRAEIF